MHSSSNLNRFIRLAWIVALLTGCNLPTNVPPGTPTAASVSEEAHLPPAPETLVSFRVVAPANTPPGTQVFLTLLDEVTGLALNPQAIPMEIGALGPPPTGEPQPDGETGPVYVITLPFPIGSVIQYRYERSAEAIRVAEHLSDGSAVRYRMLHVGGQILVDDVISRWTDTPYTQPSGRIAGKAQEASGGAPIPSLLVSAGGAQTITASDGSFLLEGLPPGVHNLVAYAMDGSFHTFQQGARVAAESTTPANLKLNATQSTRVMFVVRPPQQTFSVVPLRLAGNLVQLGNTFANLRLGASTLPANTPQMERLPDGRYTLTVTLPVGAHIRYKYTLGDGYWNAEHNLDGSIRLREFIVPETPVIIEDVVDSWQDAAAKKVTFDLTVPPETPADDFISIQFDPLFGWTEPIPMWNLGGGRWAYILYSPLALPGDLTYRYCRNGQCGLADDAAGMRKAPLTVALAATPAATPGSAGGLPAGSPASEITVNDTITAWAYWPGPAAIELPAVETQVREGGFQAGIELLPSPHPSWQALFPDAMVDLQASHANLVILRPSWSYGRMPPGNSLPLLSAQPERDATWFALQSIAGQVKAADIAVALYPTANFLERWDQWWLGAPRQSPGWWAVWFDQYRTFILHHADLAAQIDAEALVLGGEWLSPALPGGLLTDGQPSGAPEDAEEQWRVLISEVRSRYNGRLLWALDVYSLANPPVFLDEFDQIYLTLSLPAGKAYADVLDADLDSWLDNTLFPFQYNTGLPVLLGVELPSSPDLGTQLGLYQRALAAAAERDWISGVVSRGYYPAAALQDNSTSINGKPAAQLLAQWYAALLGR